MELDQFRDVDLVIDYANYSFIEKQFVSQGDYKGRTLTVQITNNGVVGEVPGLMLNLNWHNQASGLTDLSAFSVLDKANSIYRIEYPQHMMTPGKVLASIQVIQNGKVTNLKQFELTVQKLAGQPVGIVEKAEFSALVAVLANSNRFRTDIDTLDINKADKKDLASTNATMQNGLASKVDKNGNEQITMGMLSQPVKEAISGGSVAVVGKDSVNTTNIVNNAVTVSKLDNGIIKTYPAESLVFRWGSMNANDGSFVGVNNIGLSSTRAVSYGYEYRKGSKFKLNNTTNYKAWVNIFYSDGSWNKSISLNSATEWILEEDSIIYIVVGIAGDGQFDAKTLYSIQSSIDITTLKSDYDFKFPDTSRIVSGDDIEWYPVTINIDTGEATASNTRLSSDYIYVPKGTEIYSDNPSIGKWAVHVFDLNKKIKTADGKPFGNSYLNALIKEDSYIRLTIANIDDTTIDPGGEVAKKITSIKLPFLGNLRGIDSINNPTQKVSLNFLEFIYGSGNLTTGELTFGGRTRIRNKQLFFAKKNSIIEIESDQQFAVYFYDILTKTYSRDHSIGFLKGRSKYFAPDDGYFAVVLAAADDSNIEDVSDLASKVTLRVTNDNYLMLQEMIASQNTKALEEINLPFEFGSSLAFVGDELWNFHPSEDDNSTQAAARAYEIDFEVGNIVRTKSILINWGHVNTLNYSQQNDSLVFSNGNIGDTNERSKKFYVLENFSAKTTNSSIDISECIEYNTTNLGIENTKGLSVALQPCWGDSNDYRNNVVYLLWNDGNMKKISKILLGQGTNDLGNGSFITEKESNEFNGTMKLIATYDGHSYTDKECTQDATYAHGYIFEGIGHDGFWYDKIKLDEETNTFSKVSFQERSYSSDGNLYNTVTNGAAVKDGFLFSTVYHRANKDSNVDYVKLVSRKLL